MARRGSWTTLLLAGWLAAAAGGQAQGPVPTVPTPVSVAPAVAPAPPSPDKPADKTADADAKKADKPDADRKSLTDSLHQDDQYGLKSLFDSLHPADPAKGKAWYEKLSFRGYTQFRVGRSLFQDALGADPSLLGDRSITGRTENFFIRRARFILAGDVSDHLGVYVQPDFANTPPNSSTGTLFAQIRDLYADVYLDTDKVNRFRVGQSKVPFGFENMQSSGNRVPLDRTDAINSAVSPNERDLGVFYYWTPVEQQKLLRELVDGGLKGSGNFGLFALGVYNGQGGGQLEQNLNLHTVARVTYPVRLASGQVVEASLQGYTGNYVVEGAAIRPLGAGPALTPAGTRPAGEHTGQRDQRLAGTLVWYPQPFGVQAEWNVGEGPGLNNDQTAVITRPLHGGYVMAMYKHDTLGCGVVTPYCRWQYFHGGYRSIPNAPYGVHNEWNLGAEWQIRREMELVLEYAFVNGVNLDPINEPGVASYRNFNGGVLRAQFQFNY